MSPVMRPLVVLLVETTLSALPIVFARTFLPETIASVVTFGLGLVLGVQYEKAMVKLAIDIALRRSTR